LKTEQVKEGHVILRVKYYDAKDNPLRLKGHKHDTFYTGGEKFNEWHQVAFLIRPPHWSSQAYSKPAQAEKLRLSISLDNSSGNLWLDDIALIEISQTEYDRFDPNQHYISPQIQTTKATNAQPITFSKNAHHKGNVQQDKITGVWWLTNNKHAFWSIGVNKGTNDKLFSATQLSPSQYKKQSQYRAWHELNFNQGIRKKKASGKLSSTHNHIHWLNFSSEAEINIQPDKWVLKDRNNQLIAGEGHYFPDVFSPIWQKHAKHEAESLLDNDAWLLSGQQVLGYWTDNEWAYGDIMDYFWGETSKKAFIDWLQGHNDLPSVDLTFAEQKLKINLNVPEGFELASPYTDVKLLSQAWSSQYHQYQYTSFEDILNIDMPYIRGHDDPLIRDFQAFARLIYKIYVDTVIDNIRRVESDYITRTGRGSHRLIFSNRFAMERPSGLQDLRRNMDLFSRFDVISVNLYPDYNQGRTYYPKALLKQLQSTFYEPTGRPIYISEFGIAAEDADNCNEHPCLRVERWRNRTVADQKQRGIGYKNIVSTLANLPYIVGANWFKWSNGYGTPIGSDIRNSGLVDDNDQYYKHFTDSVRKVNDKLQNIYRQETFNLTDINWEAVELNICPPLEALKKTSGVRADEHH